MKSLSSERICIDMCFVPKSSAIDIFICVMK